MTIFIPSPLQSYTCGRREVQAEGATVAELLADMDRRFPGIRFRMVDEQDRFRQHILFFVNRERSDSPARPLAPTDEVQIICSISGG